MRHGRCDVVRSSAARRWKDPRRTGQPAAGPHDNIQMKREAIEVAGRPLFGGEHCGVGAAVW